MRMYNFCKHLFIKGIARPLFVIVCLSSSFSDIFADELEKAQAEHARAIQLYENGNLVGAIPYMEKALILYEKSLGPENPQLAQISPKLEIPSLRYMRTSAITIKLWFYMK